MNDQYSPMMAQIVLGSYYNSDNNREKIIGDGLEKLGNTMIDWHKQKRLEKTQDKLMQVQDTQIKQTEQNMKTDLEKHMDEQKLNVLKRAEQKLKNNEQEIKNKNLPEKFKKEQELKDSQIRNFNASAKTSEANTWGKNAKTRDDELMRFAAGAYPDMAKFTTNEEVEAYVQEKTVLINGDKSLSPKQKWYRLRALNRAKNSRLNVISDEHFKTQAQKNLTGKGGGLSPSELKTYNDDIDNAVAWMVTTKNMGENASKGAIGQFDAPMQKWLANFGIISTDIGKHNQAVANLVLFLKKYHGMGANFAKNEQNLLNTLLKQNVGEDTYFANYKQLNKDMHTKLRKRLVQTYENYPLNEKQEQRIKSEIKALDDYIDKLNKADSFDSFKSILNGDKVNSHIDKKEKKNTSVGFNNLFGEGNQQEKTRGSTRGRRGYQNKDKK